MLSAFRIALHAFVRREPSLCLFGPTFQVCSSLRSAKRLTARQELLSQNNSIEHIVQFFDLRSETLSSSQPVQFCYEQITRFVETPSLYCLFMGKTMCTIVKKDSFTIGNPMEFKAFLRTKCPQLKIK